MLPENEHVGEGMVPAMVLVIICTMVLILGLCVGLKLLFEYLKN